MLCYLDRWWWWWWITKQQQKEKKKVNTKYENSKQKKNTKIIEWKINLKYPKFLKKKRIEKRKQTKWKNDDSVVLMTSYQIYFQIIIIIELEWFFKLIKLYSHLNK